MPVSRHPGAELTREAYRGILRAHVGPVLGDRTMAAVAQARDDVIDLLTVRLGEGSNSRRKIARALITGVLDEGVRAGKITMHRCDGIVLPDNGNGGDHDDFVFPSHAELVGLAGGIRHPLSVWLMRGCGLRIEEALAVRKSCFRDGGSVLRVFEQGSRDGKKTGPLKHRKAGEYRDIPVPSYLWEIVKDLPGGYLFLEDGALPSYSSYRHAFNAQARRAGIAEGFTPHSVRLGPAIPRGADHGRREVAGAPEHQRHVCHVRSSGPVFSRARAGRAERRVRRMERGGVRPATPGSARP